jgi:PX domain
LNGKERASTPIMNRETIDSTCEWDIYKRYSNFVVLNDQLAPIIKSLGLQCPELPGPISNKDTPSRNNILTARKFHLEKYLTELIMLLTERAPIELLTFLNLHE